MYNTNFQLIEDSIEFIEDATISDTGFLRVKAQATRAGVQDYPEWEQTHFRPLKEVFATDSMNSLKHIPVTIMHPQARKVTSRNAKQVTVGFTTDKVMQVKAGNQDFLQVEMMVTDAAAIEMIQEKKLTEVSAGYHAKLNKESGVYDGQNYNVVQTDIRYNHMAMLPPMTARAGSKAQIILDSKQKDSEIVFCLDIQDQNVKKLEKKGVKPMSKININGVDFEVSEQVEQAFKAKTMNDSNQLTQANSLLVEKQKEVDTLKGMCDSLQKQLDKQPSLDDKVNEKISLVLRAKSLVKDPNVIVTDMKDEDIYKTVIKERLPEIVLDSLSVDHLKGAFITLKPIDNNQAKNEALYKSISDSMQSRLDENGNPKQQADVTDAKPQLTGYAKMLENMKSMVIGGNK